MTQHCDVVSVIVCYHDAPATARLCAVLAGQAPVDHAVVVIDHSSECYRAACATEYRVMKAHASELILETDNRGSAGGFRRGQAWALARDAQFIWLHDQDGEPAAGCLDALLGAMRGDERVAAAAPVVEDEDGRPQREFCGARGVLGLPRFVPPPEDGHTLSVRFVASTGLLLRSASLKAIGIYDDEHYFVGYEDFDCCARLAAAGKEIVVSGSARYRHPHLLRKRGHPWPTHPGVVDAIGGAAIRYLGVVNLNVMVADAVRSALPNALESFRYFATRRAGPLAWNACVAYSLLRANTRERAALRVALKELS